MRFLSLLSGIVKGKALIVLASVAVIGGATVAAAATPTGQNIVHTMTGATATKTATHSDNDAKGDAASAKAHANKTCPGHPEVLRLITKFALNAKTDVTVLCSLHNGTFKGTTLAGTTVSSNRVFGYGEIEKLLTLAKSLATHDQATLASTNLSNYLAAALQKCGTTPLEECLAKNVSGNGNANNNGKDNGNGNAKDNGNGNGKPGSTPTPPAHPNPHH